MFDSSVNKMDEKFKKQTIREFSYNTHIHKDNQNSRYFEYHKRKCRIRNVQKVVLTWKRKQTLNKYSC